MAAFQVSRNVSSVRINFLNPVLVIIYGICEVFHGSHPEPTTKDSENITLAKKMEPWENLGRTQTVFVFCLVLLNHLNCCDGTWAK